jgi:hypothetical protein
MRLGPLALIMLLALASPARANEAAAESTGVRHRLSASWCYQSDRSGYGEEEVIAGKLAYRRELRPGFGWTLDAHVSHARNVEYLPGTRWLLLTGPGLHVRKATSPIRPFFQANAWVVTERTQFELWDGTNRQNTDIGPGLGLAIGVDVVLSPHVELPLALRYDRIFRSQDLVVAGAEVGISVGFGRP